MMRVSFVSARRAAALSIVLLAAASSSAASQQPALQKAGDDEIDRRVAAVMPQVITWRRDFHAHPELGNHEVRTAKIAGADQATFERLAAAAKAGCPVSKLFNTRITMDAKLVG